MNKRIDLDAAIFDPAQWLPPEIGEITNHQTDLPRIARDPKLTTLIEHQLSQIPTTHDLYQRDSREIDFLLPSSVHLVVTSPPYWTLKEYNHGDGQMGFIEDYETFLDELDRVWQACYAALVPGGRVVCVVGDVCLSRRKNFGEHVVVCRCTAQFRSIAVRLASTIWPRSSGTKSPMLHTRPLRI